MKTAKCLLVGIDFNDNGDVNVLIVGEHVDGKTNILNAFQGDEATDLYSKLITKKEKKDGVPNTK